MAFSAEQVTELLEEADRLGKSDDSPRVRLLELAQKLGVRVTLLGKPHMDSRLTGTLDYTVPPQVTIRRTARVPFTKLLSASDESLLRPRDRFTLAHEIGHWVAYSRFGIGPASTTSEYWQDEAVVNRFAATLLLPIRQVDKWLRGLSLDQGIHVHQLTRWAGEVGLSREVVSLRVCQVRRGVGFLALKVKRGPEPAVPDIVVLHSASDPALHLPARRGVIRSERLLKCLEAATTDRKELANFSFDRKHRKVATYYLSWIRTASEGQSSGSLGATYWTSWSLTGFARTEPGCLWPVESSRRAVA